MLNVTNLSVCYTTEKVLKDISFNFAGGSILGIIGPNGSGKSTLLKSILGLKNSNKGSVIWKEISPKLDIAYVPQQSEYDWEFPSSVYDLVENALITTKNFWRFNSSNFRVQVDSVLKQFNIYDLRNRHISMLSGGQKQRLLLARAFVLNPKLLILDEPFNAIDHSSEQNIFNMLKEYVKNGGTVIMVHHNLNSVLDYFDELLILNKSLVAFGTTDNVFNKSNLLKAYGSNIFLDL